MKRLLVGLLIFTSHPAFAGSWSSGGGGTGFACFETAESAQALRSGADLANRPDLVADLKGVTLTDIWENRNNTFIEPLAGESPRAFVERAISDRLQNYAPEFYKVLESSVQRVDLAMAKKSGKLPASHDTGPMNVWPTDNAMAVRVEGVPVALSPRCVQVQIALRTTTKGPKGSHRLLVSVDRALYDQLGDGREAAKIINQGALLLHEALYLLGSELGQKTSIDARRFTAMLLSNDKIEGFHTLERQLQRKEPSVVAPEKLSITNEITAEGFDTSTLGKKADRANSLAVAISGFRNAQRRMWQEFALHDTEVARTAAITFYNGLSREESIVAVASLAVGRGAIPDLLILANSRSPHYQPALDAACTYANLTLNDDQGGPREICRNIRHVLACARILQCSEPQVSIYRSTDYREIIAQLIKDKKSENSKFGLAQLAKGIGVQATYISRVVSGTRDLSQDQLHELAKYFALSEQERSFMLMLLEYSRTGLAWRKRELHRQIGAIQAEHRAVNKNLQATKVQPTVDDPMAKIYLDPTISLVMHFLNIPRYLNDRSLIVKELGLSTFQFERAIEILKEAGAIGVGKGGKFELLKPHIHMDTDSPLTATYIAALRQLTISHIHKIPQTEKNGILSNLHR